MAATVKEESATATGTNEHGGHSEHFCCQHCLETFTSDRERYETPVADHAQL